MTQSGTDEELMCRYRDGDARAFEWLYARHKGAVYRYLRRQCSQAAQAEELFQDVWMNLIRTRDRYDVQAKFTTYLYRIAHNRLVDHHRSQARYAERFDASVMDAESVGVDEIDPGRQVEAQRIGEQIRQLVSGLPFEQREAFLLHEEAGFSVEEIADLTEVGKETAKSRLRYAVRKLRNALAESR